MNPNTPGVNYADPCAFHLLKEKIKKGSAINENIVVCKTEDHDAQARWEIFVVSFPLASAKANGVS